MFRSTASTALQPRTLAEPAEALRVTVLSDAAPERNGVGAYYHDLVEHLGDAGHDAEILCPGATGGGQWDGRVHFPLPGDTTQRLALPPVRRIRRHLDERRPHTVVVATPGPYGFLGLHEARRRGARLVIGFHTSFEQLMGLYWNRVLSTLAREYFRGCNRLLFRYGDVVLANSRHMAADAERIGARDVVLMGTPLPAEFLHTPPAPVGQALGRVLFAGRLAAEKNIQSVVAAAEALPHISFRIAGDGPLHRSVAADARRLPNLEYLGWLERESLMAAMDDADLLVLPSHVEAFGTIALEAMVRGRNVLVSSRCGIVGWPELERGLYRIRDGEEVAGALARIADLDPGLRAEKARIARRAASALNDETVARWEELLAGAP